MWATKLKETIVFYSNFTPIIINISQMKLFFYYTLDWSTSTQKYLLFFFFFSTISFNESYFQSSTSAFFKNHQNLTSPQGSRECKLIPNWTRSHMINYKQDAAYSVHWVACVSEGKNEFLWHSGEVLVARVFKIYQVNFILFGVISLKNCKTLLEYK